MLLGGLFKATGNRPPVSVPAKGRYIFKDFLRYAKRAGLPFEFNPYFPINTLALMRAATALLDSPEQLEIFNRACFDAIWRDKLNMTDPKIVMQVLGKTSLDLTALMAETQNPVIKEELKRCTQEAVDRGVFGAPTFFFRKEMYWGQDRLFMIEEQLRESMP